MCDRCNGEGGDCLHNRGSALLTSHKSEAAIGCNFEFFCYFYEEDQQNILVAASI